MCVNVADVTTEIMTCFKFPDNHIVLLVLLINLVIITSFPHTTDAEYKKSSTSRSKRSYQANRGSKEQSPGNSVKSVGSFGRAAVFATENSTVVVAQIGGTASLPCVVRKFSYGVVSWIRKSVPPTLLTVGLTTYSADDRFFVEHARHEQNWGLFIKHVQPTDAGLYECQISTHPPTSVFIKLKVTEALADILGAPDLHIRAGSLLRLVCTFRHSTESPSFVFWYHEHRMINYDPGVKVIPNRSSSILLLQEADNVHSGNYTCSPSNAIPASINIHVLNATEEENPAAMLHANVGSVLSLVYVQPILFTLLIIIFLNHLDR